MKFKYDFGMGNILQNLFIQRTRYGYKHLFTGIQKARNCYLRLFLMNDIYFEDQLLFSRLHIKYELIQDVLICKTIEASTHRKENSLHISPSWLICFSFCLNLQHFVFIQTAMNLVWTKSTEWRLKPKIRGNSI